MNERLIWEMLTLIGKFILTVFINQKLFSSVSVNLTANSVVHSTPQLPSIACNAQLQAHSTDLH